MYCHSFLTSLDQGFFALAEHLLRRAPASFAAPSWFVPVLAQATFDSALTAFVAFLSRILLLIGIAVVAYGGWLISQGKNADGVMAIIGGFVIVAAVPIIRLLASMVGSGGI